MEVEIDTANTSSIEASDIARRGTEDLRPSRSSVFPPPTRTGRSLHPSVCGLLVGGIIPAETIWSQWEDPGLDILGNNGQ